MVVIHRHTEMDRPVPMNRTVDQHRVQRRVRLQGDGDGLEDDVVQVIITTDECAIPASPASALGPVAVCDSGQVSDTIRQMAEC